MQASVWMSNTRITLSREFWTQDYLARPDWDSDRQTRGSESLLAQNRAAMWGRTPVVACYGDGGNICSAAALQKRAHALLQKIYRLVAP